MIQNVADSTLPDSEQDQSKAGVPCPRCGYDQRGVMRQWTETCPLQGICAECGLEYRWAELLAPQKFEPKWCVEFAPRGIVSLPASCVKTAIRTLWPWHFWKRLNMAFDVRWRRIVLLWLILLLPMLGVYVVEQTAVAVQVWLQVRFDLTNMGATRMPTVQELESHLQYLEAMEISEDIGEGGTGNWQYWTEDRRQEAIQLTKNLIASVQQGPAGTSPTPTLNQPLWRAILEAVLTPRSTTSKGTITGITQGDVYPYPSPMELHETLGGGYFYYRSPDNHVLIFFVGTLCLGLLIFMPLEFALLPISRRKAKVQWRHVWRVAAYLIVPILIVATLAAAIYAIGLAIPEFDDKVGVILACLSLAPFAVIIIWWAVAIKRYLRMPNGWLIAPLFAVLSVLIFVAILFWVGQLIFGPQAVAVR